MLYYARSPQGVRAGFGGGRLQEGGAGKVGGVGWEGAQHASIHILVANQYPYSSLSKVSVLGRGSLLLSGSCEGGCGVQEILLKVPMVHCGVLRGCA